METVKDKIVLVTGASRGIGAYIVRELTEQGARVVGVARSNEGLEATGRSLKDDRLYSHISFDLQNTDRLGDLVRNVRESVGPIDILVNNAGMELYQHYQNYSTADLQKILMINLFAPMELTRLVLPDMLIRGGHIVSIASLAGKKGIAYNSIYSASKAGIIMWTDGLRQELAGTSAGISVICPGYISEVGMFYDGGVDAPSLLGTSTPKSVAQAVLNAILKKKAEIIVNKGPIKPLLAIGQITPAFGDRVVRWFGVPEVSRKRIKTRRDE